MTRVLVVGAGSIGRRHATVLHAAGAEVDVTDVDEARARDVPGARSVPMDLGAGALDAYDGVVVASPTVFHLEHLHAALRSSSAKVLVEKPLTVDTKGLDEVVAEGNGRVMVGFNLRCHRPVARAVQLVREGRAGSVVAARLWFGSWLPDWRPAVDYRTSYSARAELGGGVLLDAIHELDVLLWLFGDSDDDAFAVTGAFVGRVGPLEIDVEDTVKALLRHRSGAAVEVSLDYLSRRYRRGIEVIGTEATVRLDWARQVIEVEDASGVVTEPATDPLAGSYEEQARRFLAFVREGAPPPVDAAAGAASVRLAEAIRSAAAAAA